MVSIVNRGLGLFVDYSTNPSMYSIHGAPGQGYAPNIVKHQTTSIPTQFINWLSLKNFLDLTPLKTNMTLEKKTNHLRQVVSPIIKWWCSITMFFDVQGVLPSFFQVLRLSLSFPNGWRRCLDPQPNIPFLKTLKVFGCLGFFMFYVCIGSPKWHLLSLGVWMRRVTSFRS